MSIEELMQSFAIALEGDISTLKNICAPDCRLWHSSDNVWMEQGPALEAFMAAQTAGVIPKFGSVRTTATAIGFVAQTSLTIPPIGRIHALQLMRVEDGKIASIEEYIGPEMDFAAMVGASGAAVRRGTSAAAGADLDKLGGETLAVMERHVEAMKTRDVEKIAADYAEDTVVIATLFPKPIIGKEALRKAIAEALRIPPITSPTEPVFKRKEAVGELGFQIFENEGLIGSETYVVRDGKIVFETADITLKEMLKAR